MGLRDDRHFTYSLKTTDKDETAVTFLKISRDKGSFTLLVLESSLNLTGL